MLESSRASRRGSDLSVPQVVEAKAGAGSATLSMAAAAAEFADACMRGMQGDPGVVACAYVQSSLTDLPFFASKCVLLRAHHAHRGNAHSGCPTQGRIGTPRRGGRPAVWATEHV